MGKKRAILALGRLLGAAGVAFALAQPGGWGPFTGRAWGQEVTDMAYQWERVFYGGMDGKRRLLFNDTLSRAKMALGDLDHDGDRDMILGRADGRLSLFRNTGSKADPRWELVEEDIQGIHREGDPKAPKRVYGTIQVQEHAAPVLADMDGDGDLDLLVGDGAGKVVFYRNIGNPQLFYFELEEALILNGELGKDAVPLVMDVNGDQRLDLLVGVRSGAVYYLPNGGDQHQAAFCLEAKGEAEEEELVQETEGPAGGGKKPAQAECRKGPRLVARMAPESFAAPGLADWDGDGDLDLFVGKADGTIAYLANKGSPIRPQWKLVQGRFLALDSGGYAAPTFMDINRDGRSDFIIGSGSNLVYTYTGKQAVNLLDVWLMEANSLEADRFFGSSGGLVLASGDLDGDGDLDLVIGNRDGRMRLFIHEGKKDKQAWRLADEDFLPDRSRANAAPALADLDGDGDLDLLVGMANGRLELFVNDGGKKKAQWRADTTAYGGVDVGDDARPVLADLDKDGDLDLFIGNYQGRLVFYLNQGTAQAPDFRLKSTRFANVSVGHESAPAFFDWDEDGQLDLVVGSQQGRLHLFRNLNPPDDASLRAWRGQENFWLPMWRRQGSLPHFNDFNGDKRPDFLLADWEGNLFLRYNRKAEKVMGQLAKAEEPPPPPPQEEDLPPPQEEPGVKPIGEGAGSITTPLGAGPIPPSMGALEKDFGDLKFDGRTVPAFGDLDGDGDLDLVVGTSKGEMILFINTGTATDPKWKEETRKLGDYGGGHNPSPTLADMDGDGLLDLLVGGEDGLILLFLNSPGKGQGGFTQDKEMLKGVRVGKNAVPAVADLNGDGQPDLLVGNLTGNLVAFLNQGPGSKPRFKLSSRRYNGIDVGMGAAPFVGDLDLDNNPDLLVGSSQGNVLYFKKNTNMDKKGLVWIRGEEDYLKAIKFPRGTTPVLADLDGDGDQDLFVGTDNGRIYRYKNEANPRGGKETEEPEAL